MPFLRSILMAALLLASGPAHAISKDIQADMLMVKITSALKADKFSEALPAMADLEALGTPLSEDFQFLYIDTLDRAGKRVSALSRCYGYLEKYGRAGGYYGRVIEITTRLQDLADKDAKAAAEAAAEAARRDKDLWQQAKASASPKVLDDFIFQNPNSAYLSLAKEMLDTMREFVSGKVIKDCVDCPEMVMIGPGTFTMGSADGNENERPPHQVTISHRFAVGKYAVTQGEWEAVMGTNPSRFRGSRNPVERVSWNDAQRFISRLNAKIRSGQSPTGGNGPYRLLTEAEWEYAARAGTTTKYPWGDSIGSGNANCNGCGSQWDDKTTAPVGSFPPNAFGLYDMHGNVLNWVQDCFVDYALAPADGSAVSRDSCNRIVRGASWNSAYASSSDRSTRDPNYPSFDEIGFRLARELP